MRGIYPGFLWTLTVVKQLAVRTSVGFWRTRISVKMLQTVWATAGFKGIETEWCNVINSVDNCNVSENNHARMKYCKE